MATEVATKWFRSLPGPFKARTRNVPLGAGNLPGMFLGVSWGYLGDVPKLFANFLNWPDLGLADCPRGGVPAPKVRVNHAFLVDVVVMSAPRQ